MRIFIVDDDPVSLEPLEARLRQWGHEVSALDDGEAAWDALIRGELPDVAILDWMMPKMDGLELCRRIRARPDSPYMYIIMLTGRADPTDFAAGFDAGADDYLSKPVNWGELEMRLRAAERIVDLQNELIAAREALRVQAMQDPLTKALNHGAILDALSRELDRSHREGRPLSIILADLDEFKKVNDDYGHLVGDHVLIEVTRRVRNCLRSYDAMGRYGGEEFLVVLPNTDPTQAADLAERIRLALSREPFKVGGNATTVTLSQGVTTWVDPHPIPTDLLIQSADRALYAVKNSGRNAVRCVRFEPSG